MAQTLGCVFLPLESTDSPHKDRESKEKQQLRRRRHILCNESGWAAARFRPDPQRLGPANYAGLQTALANRQQKKRGQNERRQTSGETTEMEFTTQLEGKQMKARSVGEMKKAAVRRTWAQREDERERGREGWGLSFGRWSISGGESKRPRWSVSVAAESSQLVYSCTEGDSWGASNAKAGEHH